MGAQQLTAQGQAFSTKPTPRHIQYTLPCRKYIPQAICLSVPSPAPFALLLEGPHMSEPRAASREQHRALAGAQSSARTCSSRGGGGGGSSRRYDRAAAEFTHTHDSKRASPSAVILSRCQRCLIRAFVVSAARVSEKRHESNSSLQAAHTPASPRARETTNCQTGTLPPRSKSSRRRQTPSTRSAPTRMVSQKGEGKNPGALTRLLGIGHLMSGWSPKFLYVM